MDGIVIPRVVYRARWPAVAVKSDEVWIYQCSPVLWGASSVLCVSYLANNSLLRCDTVG